MSIIETAENIRHKAQSAVATARLSGYKLISQAQTEKARAAARAVSGSREAAARQGKLTRSQVSDANVTKSNSQLAKAQGRVIRTSNKKVA